MHLLFDLDGTITDSREGIVRCFQHALGALGADVPGESELASYIGSPLSIAECFTELLQTADTMIIERAVTAYRIRFEHIGMFENVLYPGAKDALLTLSSNGSRLHVVTAKPAVYAWRILRHFEIETLFTSLQGPELTTRQFTKASLIRQALVDSHATPDEMTMIGDRAADVAAARQNAVRSIGVTWGYGERHEFAEADHVVESWSELVACVQRAV